MSSFLLTSRDRRPRLSAFNHSLSRPPYYNSLSFIVLSYILWNWRNAFFDTTERPLYPHGTLSSILRNALFTLKIRLLCYHETPSLRSRYALFAITKLLSYSDLIPSFHLPFLHLPATLCLQMGTDALVWKPLPVSPKGRSN